MIQLRTKLLRVSSKDRDTTNPNESNSSFSVEIPDYATNRVSRIETIYASCPNIFQNVTSLNNTIRVIKTTGAVVYDVTIPEGQYNVTQLATILQDTISTAINPDSLGVVVSTASGDSRTILRFTWVGDTYAIDYDNSTIRDVIGLTADIGPAVFYDLQSEVNLTGVSEVYIHSKDLSQSNTAEAQGTFSALDVLSLAETPYGAVVGHYYKDPTMHHVDYAPFQSERNLTKINIRLRDSEGNLLTLPDNFYFTLILRLHYK